MTDQTGGYRPTPMRWLAAVAALTAMVLLTSACGGEPVSGADAGEAGDETTEATGEESPTASAEEQPSASTRQFPITIDHKYGATTIEAEPTRVVSVGYNDQDDLLALGVVPVGIRDWYGDQPFATWPWAQDELGEAEPEVLEGELNFERVAALRPDLIIGISSGMTAEEYETLSAIAPTLAQSDEYVDYGVPWQVQTRVIGQAVGRADEADALVTSIEDRFREVRQANPDFVGATAAVAFFYDGQPGAYTSSDARSRIMTDLGFTIPPRYDEIAGDSFYASFSAEKVELLDVDALVWLTGTEAEREAIAGYDLRSTLEANAEGREVFVGQLLGGAFSFASPLSLDYLLDELVPELAAAVDGDPSTPVPSAGTTGATGDPAAAAGVAGGDEAAAMEAWALVFDSATDFADKAPHLADAATLESSNEAYAAAGETMGGISLDPTGAEVDGDTATVTYDVLFGDTPAYTDLTGTIDRVDGVWTVGRDEYCGFLASARTPCDQ